MALAACGSETPGGGEGNGGGTTAPAETFKFTYNNFFPPTHNCSIMAEMWMKEITDGTNGNVTFEYLPGASLTTPDKVYDGVVTGISDIGMSCVAYTPGLFPLTEIVDNPQGYPSGYAATMASNDYYNEFKPAEFDQTHVFYFYATGPQVLFTTKKKVATLADVKGLVIRSTGVGAAIAKALGAEGIAARRTEGLPSLCPKAHSGRIAPPRCAVGVKQAEVVKDSDELSHRSVTNMYVVMNRPSGTRCRREYRKGFKDVRRQVR